MLVENSYFPIILGRYASMPLLPLRRLILTPNLVPTARSWNVEEFVPTRSIRPPLSSWTRERLCPPTSSLSRMQEAPSSPSHDTVRFPTRLCYNPPCTTITKSSALILSHTSPLIWIALRKHVESTRILESACDESRACANLSPSLLLAAARLNSNKHRNFYSTKEPF